MTPLGSNGGFHESRTLVDCILDSGTVGGCDTGPGTDKK